LAYIKKNYHTRKELQALQDLVDSFSGVTHIEYLKDNLMPRILTYKATVKEFTDNLEQIRLIIRRFDECIALKASKSEFDAFRHTMQEGYLTIMAHNRFVERFC
jgi:hypothetical protein